MKGKVFTLTGVSCALLVTSAMGSPMQDNIRGAEWQAERAITQNLPSPQYRNSFNQDRYSEARDRFGAADHRSIRDDRYNRRGDSRYRSEQRFRRQYDGMDSRFRNQGQRTAHTLTGTLLRIKGDHYVVNLRNGERSRLHVNENTLVDAGLERGDRLIAKVQPNGHAISIIKDRGRKGEHFIAPGRADENRYRSNDRYERERYNRSGYSHDSDRY